MSFFRSLSGLVRFEITGADVYGTLKKIFDRNITVQKLERVNELTIRFSVSRHEISKIKSICGKTGDTVRIIKKMGVHWALRSMCNRPVLIAGILLITGLAIFLPTRIWIVQIEGNTTIPQHQILESAEACGIRFGASRRLVRSEQMKNQLLGTIPELQWAGINTYGSRAVISVREREVEHPADENMEVSSIVASMDGIITECTVTAGNGLCSPGQAVTKGQVLISGYTDCGLTVRATRAEGDILALTRRVLSVVTPSERLLRQGNGESSTRYSMIHGKKRINFYKGSGISGSSCVKMYSKYVLTLPGGFELPLAIVRETIVPAALELEQIAPSDEMLALSAEAYLLRQMIAGRILQTEEQIREAGGVFCLTGKYACLESIGMRREEKIGE